jgi:hypothetical protein
MQSAVQQQESAAQLRPRTAVAVLPDAAAPPQLEAQASPQQEQVSPRAGPQQVELRAQAEPVQLQALEEQRERELVQPASLPAQPEQRQVSLQPAARRGVVVAVPRPLLSSE